MSTATVYTIGVVPATGYNGTDMENYVDNTQQLRFAALAQLALTNLQNGLLALNPPMPVNDSIALVFYSSAGTAGGSIAASRAAIKSSNKIVGLIGASVQAEIPIAVVGGAANIPVYVLTLGIAILNNKINYPVAIRGRSPDIAAGQPMIALILGFGWKKVCYVGSGEQYGQGMLGYLNNAIPAAGIEFRGVLFSGPFVDPNAVVASASTSFTVLIQQFDCRIFILHAPTRVAAFALKAAGALGLLYVLSGFRITFISCHILFVLLCDVGIVIIPSI